MLTRIAVTLRVVTARGFGAVAGVLLLLGLLAAASPARAQTSGDNGTHDPSRMIVSEGLFYVYSTGAGSKSSPDGLVWKEGPGLFPGGIPSSTTSVVSNNEGVWAPDLIYLNGQYYLYYAIANAKNACAIGLVTSPTLNPKSADYKWTDRGLVVSNSGSATYCAIDPAPVLDTSGNLWLSWGSGYTHASTANTIYVTRLDNMTGLPISNQPTPGYPLEQGHIEASYLYYHEGSYYLFWNSGGCCSGASSTYEIHVARSPIITGPYTGAKIFYSSTGGIHGPGQIGVYDQCGASRFTYHYYPDAGGSVLGENELSWGSDGWPVVGAISNTPLTPCAGAAPDAGGAGGASGTSSSSGAGGTATGGSTGEGAGGSTTVGSGGAAAVTGSSSAASGSGGKSGDGVGGGETGGAGAGGRSVASGCSCEIEGSSNDTGMALLFGVAIEVARRRGKRDGRR